MTGNSLDEGQAESYLERLKQSRDTSAVLKLRFANLRSTNPTVTILVFEGGDDKIVYASWISKIRNDLRYEPFLCDGKRGVRLLKNSLTRDMGNLGANVYFFVDRDFDDLDFFVDDDYVFMTDRYSVENYLVEGQVLQAALRDAFPCHERPDIRNAIVKMFENARSEFLSVSSSFNLHLYFARKLKIELLKELPKRVSPIASISLESTTSSETPIEEVVVYSREPSEAEKLPLIAEFDALDPLTRYRGKNLYAFFKRWIDLLCDEFCEPKVGCFENIDQNESVRRAELTLGYYSGHSKMPNGLQDFVLGIENV